MAPSSQDGARLQSVLDHSHDVILFVDSEGRIDSGNDRVRDVFGFEPSEVEGLPLAEALFGDDSRTQALVTDLGAAVVPWAAEPKEVVCKRKNGENFPASIVVAADGGQPGAFVVILGTLWGDPASQQLDLHRTHGQKLEAVGSLASGIAHEINTPTQYVGDSIHFVRNAFENFLELLVAYQRLLDASKGNVDDELIDQVLFAQGVADLEYMKERVPKALERSVDGIDRIAAIVGALKEFGHPAEENMEPADINRILRNTLTVACNEYKYVADVDTQLGDLPMVSCLPGDLGQVFLNLIVNAAHAISGQVHDNLDRGLITVRSFEAKNAVIVEIEDTGGGIPKEVQSRIFEPFFTTKEVGKGTGQGLAIAKSIVTEKHGGSLSFRSTPGEGTIFRLRLPHAVVDDWQYDSLY